MQSLEKKEEEVTSEEEEEKEEEEEGKEEEEEEYDEEEHEEVRRGEPWGVWWGGDIPRCHRVLPVYPQQETDYVLSYFDNGESFGPDSDDNGDEAVY